MLRHCDSWGSSEAIATVQCGPAQQAFPLTNRGDMTYSFYANVSLFSKSIQFRMEQGVCVL